MKTYKWHELSEEQKKQIVEDSYDFWMPDEWWDDDECLLNPSPEFLEEHHIRMPKEYDQWESIFSWDDLFFSLDRNYIEFKDLGLSTGAVDYLFRRLLRLPKRIWEFLEWEFYTSPLRNSSTRIVFDFYYYGGKKEDFTECEVVRS